MKYAIQLMVYDKGGWFKRLLIGTDGRAEIKVPLADLWEIAGRYRHFTLEQVLDENGKEPLVESQIGTATIKYRRVIAAVSEYDKTALLGEFYWALKSHRDDYILRGLEPTVIFSVELEGQQLKVTITDRLYRINTLVRYHALLHKRLIDSERHAFEVTLREWNELYQNLPAPRIASMGALWASASWASSIGRFIEPARAPVQPSPPRPSGMPTDTRAIARLASRPGLLGLQARQWMARQARAAAAAAQAEPPMPDSWYGYASMQGLFDMESTVSGPITHERRVRVNQVNIINRERNAT